MRQRTINNMSFMNLIVSYFLQSLIGESTLYKQHQYKKFKSNKRYTYTINYYINLFKNYCSQFLKLDLVYELYYVVIIMFKHYDLNLLKT